jgi:hypothetical protein
MSLPVKWKPTRTLTILLVAPVSEFKASRISSFKLSNLHHLPTEMVYYFTSNVVDPSAFIYVGKDKVEST